MEKTVIAKWKIKEPSFERILALLPELMEKTRSEKGNISYTIFQTETEPRELYLFEQYVDAEAADAHRNSEHYKRIVQGEIVPHLEIREIAVVKKLA